MHPVCILLATASVCCGRVSNAIPLCSSDAGEVKGMRPYPGHQLRPESSWSPIVDAYYNASDTEDTGAGMCKRVNINTSALVTVA